MFKPFFIHSHREPGKLPNRSPRGYTIHVEPDAHIKGNVLVRVAWCSPKDQFVKALGREKAIDTWPLSVPMKQLPYHVAQCDNTLWYNGKEIATERAYFHLFKRML